MEIKDYKCKCNHNDFFFANKGNQKGIYCSYCGKWFKWADKDEQNLAMKQESYENKIIDEHYKKGFVNGIRTAEWRYNNAIAEIKEHADRLKDSLYGDGMRHCIEIIDKYKAESEGKEWEI